MFKSFAFGTIVCIGLAYISYVSYSLYSHRHTTVNTSRPVKKVRFETNPEQKSGFSEQYLTRIREGDNYKEIQPGEYNIDEHLEQFRVINKRS